MAKVSMEAQGRFGQMMAAAVTKKNMSLRDLAAKLDCTYEQLRKIWTCHSLPGKTLTKEICRILDLNLAKAEEAINADRMERQFGESAFNMMGRDPRIRDIEYLLPQLNKHEWEMFVNQIRGYVHQKRRGAQ